MTKSLLLKEISLTYRTDFSYKKKFRRQNHKFF